MQLLLSRRPDTPILPLPSFCCICSAGSHLREVRRSSAAQQGNRDAPGSRNLQPLLHFVHSLPHPLRLTVDTSRTNLRKIQHRECPTVCSADPFALFCSGALCVHTCWLDSNSNCSFFICATDVENSHMQRHSYMTHSSFTGVREWSGSASCPNAAQRLPFVCDQLKVCAYLCPFAVKGTLSAQTRVDWTPLPFSAVAASS